MKHDDKDLRAIAFAAMSYVTAKLRRVEIGMRQDGPIGAYRLANIDEVRADAKLQRLVMKAWNKNRRAAPPAPAARRGKR